MTRVTNGASLRHKRVMDMLLFIKAQAGATITQIQGYMLTAHGLKFSTTAEYVKECQFAGIIRIDGILFRVAKKKVKLEAGYRGVCMCVECVCLCLFVSLCLSSSISILNAAKPFKHMFMPRLGQEKGKSREKREPI